MDTANIDRTDSLRAYPTVSAAARMIGVAPSTLTRRDDCEPLPRGARDQVLPPAEVMRLAAIYRKRSLNEVAASLVQLATTQGDAEAASVEDEIDGFFERRDKGGSVADFLQQAKRYLPSDLYSAVETATLAGKGRRPHAITGHEPSPPELEGSAKPKRRAKKSRPAAKKKPAARARTSTRR